ncbi:type II TA system antitoxin MqsA family protein [Sinorhizobium meliloti]|uniref:type II TA system antitoxin MqsA family protein n=1 Tax=Rhizobium meliloti TaxID=382 RepID=UPI001F227CC9|nr:type II TA system antitoxin MqsA family protein [Sinorhizobium meliloti]
MKEEIEGIPSAATIKRVRRKLKLSQREAGGLCKVGENSFDKYERGLVEPSGPTSQLLRILDHHPELIEELRQGAALSLMMLAWSNLLCTQREHSTRYATPDARPAAVDPYLPFRMKRATTRVDPIRTL